MTGIPPSLVQEPQHARRIAQVAPDLAAKFDNYRNGSIAYDFEFVISEQNTSAGTLNFLKPFATAPGVALNLDGGITKTRVGDRRFKMVETFHELSKLDCRDYERPNRNMLYPMTGSIGMDRIMNTFIDLAELGGGRDKFIDTITFTTTVSGGVNASVKLAPVTDRFKLVDAAGTLSSARTDVHKLIVSLAFPQGDLRLVGVDATRRAAFDEQASRQSKLKALVDLCIARAEQREDNANTLRLVPPELSCDRQFRGPNNRAADPIAY